MSSAVEAVTPFQDPSRKRRFVKIGGWIVGLIVLAVVLRLLGVDVMGWLDDVWTQIKDVPLRYLVLGAVLQILQTSLNGLAYYGILAYAYPGRALLWPIVTAYAVGVSMNNFLPANIGTFVTLLMFVAIIPGSTFPGILAAYMVNKIFFTIVGGVVYLYLFLEAGTAFDVELGWFRDHGALALLLLAGGALLVVVVVRIFWRWLKKLWAQAKEGGKILVTAAVRDARPPAPARQLRRQGRRDHGVPGRVLDPGHLRLGDERDRLELGGQHDGGDARVRGHHAGGERRRVEGLRERRHGHRLLPFPTARHDRRQRGIRPPARGPDLRLDRRQAARLAELRRRESQGEGDEGLATEGRRADGRRRSRPRARSTRSMGEALFWGLVASSSLLIGGVVALRVSIDRLVLGLVMALAPGCS